LFAEVESPHLTQVWGYGDAKRAAGGVSRASRRLSVRRLVLEHAGSPAAICQVLDKAVAGLRVASRIERGPLMLGTRASDTVVAGVYRALRRCWGHAAPGVLLLAPALVDCDDSTCILRDAGFQPRRVNGWCSSVVDLRLDEDHLRAQPASSWRNRLKLAERSGMTFSAAETPEALDWILARHDENMSAKEFVGPPAPFVRALCCATPGDWFVGQAWLPEEPAPVAGMLVCRFGRSAEFYVAWFGEAGRRTGAGNYVYWHSALEAQRRGCLRLDLGGYCPSGETEAGLRHFKKGLRGEEYRLLSEWMAY
jgi:hypothetical protein